MKINIQFYPKDIEFDVDVIAKDALFDLSENPSSDEIGKYISDEVSQQIMNDLPMYRYNRDELIVKVCNRMSELKAERSANS